jgi:PAS domain S-box-containing protein
MTTVTEIETSSSSWFDNFPDLLVETDETGLIRAANKRIKTLLDYNFEEILGKNVQHLYFESHSKTIQFPIECRLKTKQGKDVPVEIRCFPLKRGQALWIFRDLSEISEQRAKIYHKGKLAAMNEIGPSLIHDIRNALSVLGAQHYFMKHNVDRLDTEKFLQGLDIIQKASTKIEKIINQLRDLIQRQEVFEKIKLYDLLEMTLCLVYPYAHQNKAIIHNRIPRDLVFECVPFQFEQVFIHLLTNAIEAVSTSTEKDIYVEAKQTEDHLSLTFKDTGVGIDPTLQDKIFDPFFTSKKNNTGIGLYVCKNIVSKHGGTIHITSVPQEGCLVSLML